MNDTNSIAWLGLDAHSKNCVLGQLDDHGTEIKGWGFPTKPEQLIKHVQAIPATDKRLMLEESNLARWIGQLLKPHVQQLVVCDARRNPPSDDKPLGYQQLDREGVGTLKAVSYRAYLQAAKRRSGPVWDCYQASLRHTGSTTHARLNTQRKILLALWTLWLTGREFDPKEFS